MARFAISTANHQSAPTWIVTLLSLCYSTLTLGLRIWVKIGILGLDDALCGVTQLLAYGQLAAVMYSLTQGFGKNLSQLDNADQVDSAKVRAVSQHTLLRRAKNESP